MSEMVERVREAIKEAPEPFVRRNKALSGAQYEVVIADARRPISEETQQILGVYAGSEEARAVAETLTEQLRARAAIEAMREPTEAMVAAVNTGHGPGNLIAGLPVYGADDPAEAWRAMIDGALTETEPTR